MAFQRLDQCQAYPYTFGQYARRLGWEWVQALLIRPSPRRAYGWRRFWLGMFGAKLGPHSSIRNTTRIFHPWLLELGDWSMLADRVVVYNLGPIRIGAHCTVSQDAQLCAGSHDYSQPNMPLLRPPIEIGDGVWICAGAFIGPGVKVGQDAVVGARAVVTRDVPAGMVVAGNPAKVIKPRPMENG